MLTVPDHDQFDQDAWRIPATRGARRPGAAPGTIDSVDPDRGHPAGRYRRGALALASDPGSGDPGSGRQMRAALRPGKSSGLAISISRAFGTVMVSLQGSLDEPGAADLEAVMDDLIAGQGNLDVVVDLRHMILPDQAVLAIFERARDEAHRRNGRLSLQYPSRGTYQSLRALGLTALVPTVCRGEAEQSFPPEMPAGLQEWATDWRQA